MRIIQITVNDSIGPGSGLDTGRILSLSEPFRAEIALFNHPAHPGREILVIGSAIDEGTAFFIFTARIPPVEAPCPVRTGRHAEATTDAAMEIHYHLAVIGLKGGLGGTDPHAWWAIAMIAEHQELLGMDFITDKIVARGGKGVFITGLPDPLDLVLGILEIRYIVGEVAGIYTFLPQALIGGKYALVDNHPQSYTGRSCFYMSAAMLRFCSVLRRGGIGQAR